MMVYERDESPLWRMAKERMRDHLREYFQENRRMAIINDCPYPIKKSFRIRPPRPIFSQKAPEFDLVPEREEFFMWMPHVRSREYISDEPLDYEGNEELCFFCEEDINVGDAVVPEQRMTDRGEIIWTISHEECRDEWIRHVF